MFLVIKNNRHKKATQLYSKQADCSRTLRNYLTGDLVDTEL